MKIRMKTTMAGPDGVVGIGKIADFDPEKARQLVDAGYAEWVDKPERIPETAAIEPAVEKAIKPPARKRKKSK